MKINVLHTGVLLANNFNSCNFQGTSIMLLSIASIEYRCVSKGWMQIDKWNYEYVNFVKVVGL